jgi:hypothetical protein
VIDRKELNAGFVVGIAKLVLVEYRVHKNDIPTKIDICIVAIPFLSFIP